ncbi:endonuclease domain-containing protein [Pseudarthrobacter sp. J1763]|uniref:endonuclease domain-containing protein n=1 Tax=Pseudarthrobacter sp. J1763 TaxID=3420445 RepID=UPI003D2CB66E
MTVSYKSGLILMDDALRKGASIGKLEKASTALAGHRGIRTLRAVLENADPRSESAGETLAREVINALQLPAPELQVEVQTRAGLYRLDMAWRDRKIALEFDGRAKYFDYQPSDEAIFQERQREKALMEEGWIFVRLTWADLFKEAEVKSRILEAFRRSRGIASNP